MAPADKGIATTFAKPSDRGLVAMRGVEASRKMVWDIWTKPEHVPNWMTGPEGWTMPVCEMDLRPGGKWRFVWRQADGSEMEMNGVYKEVTPPERLVNTENWGGEYPETLNTLVLTERAGKTTMTSTVLYPSKEARDNALGTGMKEGWSMSYDRLEEYLRKLA